MRAHINPLQLNVKAYSKSLANLFRDVLQDTIDVKINDGLGAFCGLEEGNIFLIIHEEVLCQDSRASGMPENVEVLLDVGISVSIILPDVVSRELGFRRLRRLPPAGARSLVLRLAAPKHEN